MKQVVVFTIIFSFLFSVVNVQAKFPNDLPGPEIMPDSPFYFLKIWWEKLVIFLTFNTVKKAEKYKVFAEKRAYEAQEMLIQGKEELAEKTKELYKFYLNKALNKLETEMKKAIEHRAEQVQKELEEKVEDIKNKLKDTIKI